MSVMGKRFGFGRVRRPPGDHIGLLAALIQNVPDRLAASVGVGDRTNGASVRGGLAEAMDSMFEWPFSRGN